jgi:predicted NACHT family NTPase
LFNYISHEFNCCHISEPEQTITKLLHDGRALILLDGLDEVPEQDREEVLKQIRKFVRDYFSNQLIITCRIAEGQSRFKNFTNVEIADFTPEQIENFAKKWFVSLAQKSNREEEEGFQKATNLMVELDENERILELAMTPLLLTFICLVFLHGDELPAKRSELYEKGMNILLAKWDKDRGIKRDEIYRNLSPYDKIKLLSHVASATFEESPYYLFEQHTVQRHIADFLGTLPDADPDSEQSFHDSEAVLQAIGVQHGLLTAQAQGIYSFSHQTFQEYLVARKFVSRTEPHHLEKLVSHITEKRWREVFLLIVEMLPSADYLLLLIKQQVDSLVAEHENSQQFISYLYQDSLSYKSLYKPAAIRACAFDPSHRFNIWEDFDLPLRIEPEFDFVALMNWPNECSYQSSNEDWQFSEQQIELLMQYYYANVLLVDCLNSDCSVSCEVRSHIEDTLLLPIAEIEKRRLGD